MIWIRIFIPIFCALLGIYYGMVLLQCFTPWFRFTNRDITFGRCLVPFYYWIASTEEKPKDKFSSYDFNEDELDEEDD